VSKDGFAEATVFMDQSRRKPDSVATTIHPAALDSGVLAAECEFRATRRSGPGGQNRNKVETAVILTHRPTGIRAQASEWRTQGENRNVALHRLRLELAMTVRRPVHRDGTDAYSPSPLWRERCHGGRIVVNPDHDDFPALLAEALDVMLACEDDPKPAAQALGCSPSQLIKLLKDSPRALGLLNERRRQAGRHPLR
jgi:RF-1 domain